MRLIAWDTSSKTAALVALEWEQGAKAGWGGVRLVSEWTLNADLTHSERLLWGVHELLEAARWKLADVDVFGVGVGPGSFTGLRIGMTTARTLAHTLRKPLIGVSSLAVLARPAAQAFAQETAQKSGRKVIVVAATDASKGELFGLWGNARSILDCAVSPEEGAPGLWKRGVEEAVLSPDDLVRGIKRKMLEGGGSTKARWAIVGEARHRYPEVFRQLPKAKEIEFVAPFADHIQGRYLGQAVWEAHEAGLAREALRVHPRYLRASDAEIKLKAGALPPGPTRGN
jgi:tRNA threonylcarbamoyl adenosine modification protein YeaZ